MMLSSLLYLTLVVCTVLSEEHNDRDLFCGDVLSSSCGICFRWKHDGFCHTTYAGMFCMETCGICKQDDKRTVLDVRYEGCYRDGFKSDFERMIPMKRELLGVKSCTAECHLKGYPFAALQDAKFCMCTRKYGRYGVADDDTQCRRQCLAGSPDEKCGGPWKNAVYKIASREMLSAGVNLSDVADKLISASPQEHKTESQASGGLTRQLERLRAKRSFYRK
ncbi:hypothetical protein OS493_035413 [Desmophyllum pertusum]|uniref:WSC domain-containing protein n=1 Tax=Desmophyllum pertusum TaxID=174260 RepID=A0A9W9ZK13_9CNID|nr:hypothetical protein OS493_035413 [Desmophyllum pertusum]